MTIAEAKTILAVYRNESDAKDPLIAQALALADQNSELRTWLTTSLNFDKELSTAISQIPLPSDLKQKIIEHVQAAGPQQKFVSLLLPGFALALAASIVVALGLYFFLNANRNSPAQVAMDQAALKDFAARLISSQQINLAVTDVSEGEMRAWLHGKRSPATFTIPSVLANADRVGCQTYKIVRHRMSLMSFKVADDRLVHLFIARSKGIRRFTTRELKDEDGIGIATWSDGAFFYILADPGGLESLRTLTNQDDAFAPSKNTLLLEGRQLQMNSHISCCLLQLHSVRLEA